MRLHVLSLTCLLLTVGGTGPVAAQKPQNYPYGVPSEPWEESFGNHRAVLQIEKPAQIANLDFQWRRPDKDAGHRRFLIIHAATGDTIRNIRRIEVNDEHCRLQFGPVEQKALTTSTTSPTKCKRDTDSTVADTFRKKTNRMQPGRLKACQP